MSVRDCGLSPHQAFMRAAGLMGLAASSGFAGLGYEVVWTRMLALQLGHDITAALSVITAFFAGLPEAAKTYAIRAELAAEHKINKYGFHGTSHEYVSRQAAHELEVPVEDLNLVIFHLGNGASASAAS